MTTHSIALALTDAAVTNALEGVAGLWPVVALIALVTPHVPQVLGAILTHRTQNKIVDLQTKAVTKARAADLPTLFQSFTPVEVKTDSPDSPDGASP
ncbi:hypothetical protein [Streptomyces sp. NPDC091040]|uniref:hypothetical protein n=1 Tax=Streptomyces sp. NPDC091040 TaxID=3365972 RepID=UPI0037F49505